MGAPSRLIDVSFRGLGQSPDDPALTRRASAAQEEKRQSIRSTVLGVGTLACDRCDAPIAVGDRPLLLSDQLTCPFCRRQAAARDFLSLRRPTRPARVFVRVTVP
jgi:hypothetical protein